MTQKCSQFGKEATEVCSQTAKPKENKTTNIYLSPQLAEGDLCCKTQGPRNLCAALLSCVDPFLPLLRTDNSAVLWIHEGTEFLAKFPPFLAPV